MSLSRVTESLMAAEGKLQAHRQALVRVVRDVEDPLGLVAKSPKVQLVVDLAGRMRDHQILPCSGATLANGRFVTWGQAGHPENSFREAGDMLGRSKGAIP